MTEAVAGESVSMMSAVRILGSMLMSRARFVKNGLTTFAGNRKMNEALGYADNPQAEDFRYRYERNELAAAIVDAYPDECWAGETEVGDDDNPQVETPFEKAFVALSNSLSLWDILHRLDKLAGCGRYSCLLIGTTGDLATPVGKTKQIFFLTPFAENDVEIGTYDENIQSPRFGQPETYKFKRLDRKDSSLGKVVHWTRVIHFADRVTDDPIHGESRLKRVWNRLDDYDKVIGSGAESFWQRANPITQFDVDKDLNLSPDGKKELAEQVDELENGMRRKVRTRGVTINTIDGEPVDFSHQVDVIVTSIALGEKIPKRILAGSERGELASSQDQKAFNKRVQMRRVRLCEAKLLRPLIDRFIEFGVLPTPKNNAYTVWWEKIEELDEVQKGELASNLSKLNTQMGEVIVTPDEIRDQVWGWDPLSDEERAEYEIEDPVVEEETQEEIEARAAADAVVINGTRIQ